MSQPQKTILFADDEPWFTESLRLSLEGRGYRCISVTNMSDAVDVLSKTTVDVLVTDIMMPAGDAFPHVESAVSGFHLVGLVRRKYRQTAIVCLSVIGDQKKIQELKKEHVYYLRKGETPLKRAIELIESRATGKISFYSR